MSLGRYAMGYVGIPCLELNDVHMCLVGQKVTSNFCDLFIQTNKFTIRDEWVYVLCDSDHLARVRLFHNTITWGELDHHIGLDHSLFRFLPPPHSSVGLQELVIDT